MSQRERVELEVYNLRRKADAILAAAGDMDEYSRILITIGELQKKHNVTTGVRREMDNAKRTD
jgi:hypothetical protein